MAVIALLAAVLTIPILISRLIARPPTPTPPTLQEPWPYGQPEYHIEVPTGYEDLLPPGPIQAPALAPSSGEPKDATPSSLPVPKAQVRRIPGPRAERYVDLAHRSRKEVEKPTLIIVIDDAGYNIQQLEPFLELPFPITIAILPGLAHSLDSAQRIAQAGKEAILHQPMEALGGNDPGPGAILLSMDPYSTKETLRKNLDSLPGLSGVNNHMGSAITRSAIHMEPILDLVKERGIYYLDSLTTQDTVTAEFCAASQIPYWERDVFLDNSGDRQSILRALEEGKQEASQKGAAVLIGHVWSSELAQTLMDIYPKLVEEGYSLSTISKFMIRSASEDEDARPWN